MSREWLIVAFLFISPAPGLGQDMPLYSFLMDGGWWTKGVEAPRPRLTVEIRAGMVVGDQLFFMAHSASGDYSLPPSRAFSPPANTVIPASQNIPVAAVLTADGGTMYVGYDKSPAIMAYRIGVDRSLVAEAPYCPLRLRRAEASLEVKALTIDAAGRIYAATPEGIQVFDPTGRLSGVLALPVKGKPEALGWDGEKSEQLAVWVGGIKYTRPMKTSAAK